MDDGGKGEPGRARRCLLLKPDIGIHQNGVTRNDDYFGNATEQTLNLIARNYRSGSSMSHAVFLPRFTFDPLVDGYPVWSSDGSRLVFSSNRKGVYNLYTKLSSGAGADESLLESDQAKAPYDWSSDGRFLLFGNIDLKTNGDLWVLPFSGDKKPFPFLKTPFIESLGQFSPDGKWIAYESNESGQFEVYVQPFPGPGGKFQISTNGGAQPRWNKNGKEIFYISLDSRMMVAPVKLSPEGKSLETGAPIALFPVPIAGGALPGAYLQQYAVSADGQRFLVNLSVDESTNPPITIIYDLKAPPK